MALSSNRSPSPISTRTNPNLRNSETNSTIRRSFTGNPFVRPSLLTNPRSLNSIPTPANSPADFGRRHSMGKEGMVYSRGSEEKENEKDYTLKSMKVRSPAKGTKNFMAPTISASSKFTPSPRKKVLAERNEPDPTPISFSNGKTPFAALNNLDFTADSGSKSEMGLDEKVVVLEIPPISKDSKLTSQIASESLSETTLNSECVNFESSSKNKSPSSIVSPIIAPLDADPSLPPYDPKTNYLSPRPLFLHYKPNPRIEVILQKEKGLDFGEGKRLEDSFTSDTEETQSGDSQKESEDESSAAELTPEEEEEEPLVSEPIPISTPISTQLPDQTVVVKRPPKSQLFTRSKTISLVLVLLVSCLSITVTDSPVMKDLTFDKGYDPSKFDVFAKVNFDGFARNFKQWSSNSISYFSKLIPHLGEVYKLDLLLFSNLTASQEDLLVDGYPEVNYEEGESEENHEIDDLESVKEGEAEIEWLEEKAYPEVEVEEFSEEVIEEQRDSEIEDVQLRIQAEVNDSYNSEEVWNPEESDTASLVDADLPNNINLEDHSVLISHAPEIKSEVLILQAPEIKSEVLISQAPEIKSEVEACEIKPVVVSNEELQVQGGNDLNIYAKVESNVVDTNIEISSEIAESKALDSPLHRSEDKSSSRRILGTTLLVLALMGATTFIYLKQRKTTSPNVAVHVDPLLTKNIHHDKLSSQNWQTEVDVVGESCPSEISSFQKSSSYSKRLMKGINEAQNYERKSRKDFKRESLASSSEYSMGSPSYGSFTTYERIPIKNAYGDEEIETPVRRSSRIRGQVTSP